MNKMFKQMRIN